MRQIVDFIIELDKLKGITRKTRPLGLDRYGLCGYEYRARHGG